nr:tetratricopeptide repeat protein [Solimonas terrae]
MLDQQQYYAALAHIQQQQRLTGNSDDLRYLEAEARRDLGQSAAAEALYRGLLNGRLAGDAYHGLGLLYASRNLNTSVQYLREATRRDPTDAGARNDLGYALLRAGRYAEAMPELSTAVELEPNDDKSRNNLLLLLMLTGDEAGVKRVVDEAGITPDVVARMRSDARNLQARNAGSGVKK